MKKVVVFGMFMTAVLLLLANTASANKSEAAIEGPKEAARGSEVTLRITVTHNANTSSHYTDGVKVTANHREVARWDFTKEKQPEGAVFTKEVKIKVTEDTEVIAEANCNLHGSKGSVKHKITVK